MPTAVPVQNNILSVTRDSKKMFYLLDAYSLLFFVRYIYSFIFYWYYRPSTMYQDLPGTKTTKITIILNDSS